VYAARKKLKTALITESFGGQSLVSAEIHNWIGTKAVSGFDLGQMLEEHVKAHQPDVEIIEGDLVTAVSKLESGNLNVQTKSGKTLETRFILITSGSRRRKLGVPGEAEFEGKGVVYCSTCDAPLFKDKEVAVIGGGNAGLEAVVDLLPYASKITLMEFGETLKGDQITQDKIKANSKVTIMTMVQSLEVQGSQMVTGLKYKDRRTNEEKVLPLQGIFVEIGAVPNSEFVKDLVEMTKFGEIVVDHKTQRTSHPQIWAAGDVSDVIYKQNNISVGDAIKAVLNIYDQVHKETPVSPPSVPVPPPPAKV
jgi:NADH-dependent peroxiredoxin subunit F